MAERIAYLVNSKRAAELCDTPYTTLVFWITSGLLPEPVVPARGTGTRRLFSLLDVVRARTVARLREQGVSLQMIRRIVRELNDKWEIDDPLLYSGRLIVAGDDLLWGIDDEKLMNVLTGQLASRALVIIPVSEIIEDTRARIKELAIA